MNTKIISFVNHKGGTGKTTSCLNIGAGFARKSKKTLLVDFDSQANLSQGLGIKEPVNPVCESLKQKTPLNIINISERLDLVPSSLALSGSEVELASEIGRESILKDLIEPIKTKYDFIAIDCPPNLGLLTLNALVASNTVLIPVEAEFYSFNGIRNILEMIGKVKKHYNSSLNIGGVFFTKYNAQRSITEHIKKSVEEHFEKKLMKTCIRINVACIEASMNGEDVFSYSPNSNAAKDYAALVNEILEII